MQFILLTVHAVVTQNGDTALHIACKKGSLKVESVLITEGADQTIVNKVTCINKNLLSPKNFQAKLYFQILLTAFI